MFFIHPPLVMVNFSIINILPDRVADIYVKLKSITWKLHNTSTSIAFIEKTLFVNVIPKLAIVKGQFINETDSLAVSLNLMKSHLTKHVQNLCILSIQYNDLESLLYLNIGIVLANTLINMARRSFSKRRYLSFLKKYQT